MLVVLLKQLAAEEVAMTMATMVKAAVVERMQKYLMRI